jgi:amino acid transporter
MLSYAAVNYAIGFIMLLATMFVIGDVQSVLSTSTGEPWIQVIWNATESRGATIAMTAIVAFFFLFAAVKTNTTSSRQLYAFARDGFSSWICKVSQQAYHNIDHNRIDQNTTRSHQIVMFLSTPSSSPSASAVASQ